VVIVVVVIMAPKPKPKKIDPRDTKAVAAAEQAAKATAKALELKRDRFFVHPSPLTGPSTGPSTHSMGASAVVPPSSGSNVGGSAKTKAKETISRYYRLNDPPSNCLFHTGHFAYVPVRRVGDAVWQLHRRCLERYEGCDDAFYRQVNQPVYVISYESGWPDEALRCYHSLKMTSGVLYSKGLVPVVFQDAVRVMVREMSAVPAERLDLAKSTLAGIVAFLRSKGIQHTGLDDADSYYEENNCFFLGRLHRLRFVAVS
jgi:hypothetical protein